VENWTMDKLKSIIQDYINSKNNNTILEFKTTEKIENKDNIIEFQNTEKTDKNIIKQNIIKESHKKGQPVLVGTVSISKSEKLSSMLNKEGISHVVLNAKYHEKEAEIVAQAGKPGAVTIATNMAGRGTDIMLGGNSEYLAKQEMKKLNYSTEQIEQATAFNETDDQDILNARAKFKELEAKFDEEIKEEKEKVTEAGGLKIIGTERHESRRIDNQLRGRSGRQGDPGESKFYIALDDDLMKIFGGEAITKIYNTLGADEDMPIEAKILSKRIESAQRKVEDRNFSIRKHVLQYDDVMNTQREIIYGQRKEVLDGENLKDGILKMIDSSIENLVHSYTADLENVNREALLQDINISLGIEDVENVNKDQIDRDELISELKDKAVNIYEAKEAEFGSEDLRELERVVMLKVVDQKWMDHIDNMDELKNGIGLRAYAQKDPIIDYRVEGFDMFEAMIDDIKEETVKSILSFQNNGNSGNMLEDDFDNVESFMDQFNQ